MVRRIEALLRGTGWSILPFLARLEPEVYDGLGAAVEHAEAAAFADHLASLGLQFVIDLGAEVVELEPAFLLRDVTENLEGLEVLQFHDRTGGDRFVGHIDSPPDAAEV